ncbi:hypothetical protein [uncultured Dokdonia sp.]|uniref:hypothetical protein n=1 Tax=uncultured Dokdonia sp. TaxID=575653 RepID=UPI00261E9B17|nr:hypothetical protein [uncultured Dokdonia sp.]
MKKLSVFAFIMMLCIACSVEEETTLDEGTNLEVALENYKGIFTTADGQNRGVLDVTLSEDERSASGSLTLATGEIIDIFTNQITDLGNIKQMTFTSNDLSFTMTTGEEGETLDLGTVTFRGLESSITAGRSTERAPLSPILGSFTCIDCPAPLDNMMVQSFNIMVSNPDMSGNSTITSQTTLGGTVYNGVATQSGCVINGDQTTCNLNSGTVPGMVGTAFNPGGGPVTWSGTHTFDNGPTGGDDCSTMSGTWTWNSSTLGTVGGDFFSNSTGDCAPPPTTLLFENFETVSGTPSSTGYILRDEFPTSPDFGVIVEDISESISQEDYVGRVALSNLAAGNNSFAGFQGDRFFGVNDTDGVGSYNTSTDFISINWNDVSTMGFSTITVSALFAEGAPVSWDGFGNTSELRVEYSFDSGATWTPVFSISPTTATSNTPAGFDPENDGVGDDTIVLGNNFRELSGSFANPGSAPTVSIRFFIEHLTGTDEDVAFDNVTISGN